MTTPNQRTDAQLIAACRKGDSAAWQQLVTQYERLVYSIPLNYGLSREDAADVSQHAFTALVNNLERLRPDSNLGAWLATVARHQALRLLRKHKREMVGKEEDLADSPFLQNQGGRSATERWERVQWLNEGLDLLDARCQELLQLLYFSPKQPAYEEVAAQLNLQVGSIGPIRGRCLRRLRNILEERG